MKRQIRRGVFETNASSQHSLCIIKKGSCGSAKTKRINHFLFGQNWICEYYIYEKYS